MNLRFPTTLTLVLGNIPHIRTTQFKEDEVLPVTGIPFFVCEVVLAYFPCCWKMRPIWVERDGDSTAIFNAYKFMLTNVFGGVQNKG